MRVCAPDAQLSLGGFGKLVCECKLSQGREGIEIEP